MGKRSFTAGIYFFLGLICSTAYSQEVSNEEEIELYSVSDTLSSCQHSSSLIELAIDERYGSLSEREISGLSLQVVNYASAEDGGIGMLIIVSDDLIGKVAGSGNVMTPKYLASVFQDKLDDENVPSLICYGYSSEIMASSVGFVTREHSRAKLSPRAALQVIPEVVRVYQSQ